MRSATLLALMGMVCLLSAPDAQGQAAPVGDVVISQAADVTTPATTPIYQPYVITAGCCDQGWSFRSQIVSGRTLVAIAALAALLLAATFSHRFTNKQQSQWT